MLRWYLSGGCGEYRGDCEHKRFGSESKIWQLTDLLGKDKGRAKKVAKASNLSAGGDDGETQINLCLYRSKKLYQCYLLKNCVWVVDSS